MAGNYDRIPEPYSSEERWVVWKRKGDEKPPYIAELSPGGFVKYKASNKNPEDWRSLDDAVDLVARKKADGVGTPVIEGHIFIDLDKCVSDGVVEQWAQDIIGELDSYTEISQSGTGVHVLIKGKKPTGRSRKGNVEIYDHDRFIYFTGDVIDDHETIEERDVDWLCEQTFGSTENEPEPIEVGELILDPNAAPPADKLDVLLKDRDFARTWKHKRDDLPSLSEYDLSLTGFAYRAGWTDQQIANLIIASRRQYGTHDELKKALRQDYIKRTLGRIKTRSGVLELLPYKEVKLLRFGTEDSEYELWGDGKRILRVASSKVLLSPRDMEGKFYDNSIVFSPQVWKQWKDITAALLSTVENIETVTREDTTRAWLDDYIGSRTSLPQINSEDDIKRLFGSGLHSIAVDGQGRVYVRLADMVRYYRVHTGGYTVTAKTVAHDLSNLGFRVQRVRVLVEGLSKERQIRIWVSEPGFIDAGDEEGDACDTNP